MSERPARIALFDDYSSEPGHHPDLLIGLARAGRSRVYCPDHFLQPYAGLTDSGVEHVTMYSTGDLSMALPGQNLAKAWNDAERQGADCVFNLFLDENFPSVLSLPRSSRVVHALHRPREFIQRLPLLGIPDQQRLLESLRFQPLVVVHTDVGLAQASEVLSTDRLIRLRWPAASAAEIRSRFNSRVLPDEGYVLLIGEALAYKGFRLLLTSLQGGPPLRVAGNVHLDDQIWINKAVPTTRVSWESGWVSQERMSELIAGASVVVFPYAPDFAFHGGASGALVQAVTFFRPVIISDGLIGQLPEADSILEVPYGDAGKLRAAIDSAFEQLDHLNEMAEGLLSYLLSEHTYDGHLEGLASALEAST